MAFHAIVSKAILLVLNVVFVGMGGAFIFAGIVVRGSPWSDILSANVASTVGLIGTLAIVAGAVFCAIACAGVCGALCRNKCLLVTYAIFVFLAMALFVTAAVLAFESMSIAASWTDAAFPATTSETDVATGFDQAYCYAEAGRLCTSASAHDALAVFLPDVAATISTLAFDAGVDMNATAGVAGFCHKASMSDELARLLPSEYTKACDACVAAGSVYTKYSAIFQWANAQCPLTVQSSTFCGHLLLTNQQVSGGSDPYATCRPVVLALWKSTSKSLAIASVVLAIVALILVAVSCQVGGALSATPFSKA
ncbi:Aste57867_1625 [Aphanomyces stellatus]|uniref:Aste57867_1625 protein n=1 Tax=Aphanomyces stellatus TaxID=120398 RepID=A0A485K5R2_9STRA|nr:hypothetical protein As57867_001623 [Aphanomyces stellatus]VFT78838.1 Aste57867_1625 [Aphanomyces stellatus]